jgi:hypothetical protein
MMSITYNSELGKRFLIYSPPRPVLQPISRILLPLKMN